MARALTILAVLACGVGLTIAGGCGRPDTPFRTPLPPPTAHGATMTPAERLPKNKAATDYLLVVRLQLVMVRMPIGSVSDTEELWSYLNEEPAGAKVTTTLARNGIRVGYGRPSDWPEVERILRRLTGRPVAKAVLTPAPDTPVAYVLKQDLDVQTIFTYRRDRTLVGFDYPPGDNVLMLGGALDFDDLAGVTLMGAPVVRSAYRQPRYSKEMGPYVLSYEQRYFELPDLGFQFKVPAGGFVLIGPGQDVRRDTSPGAHFLVQEKNGLKFETVLVIWPEAFAAAVVSRQP